MELYIHVKNIYFLRKPQLKALNALLLVLLLPFMLQAQDNGRPTINSKLVGKVIDAITKEPLAGAVVRIKGTTHAVAANAEGSFSFQTGQKFPYTLQITFIGYEKQELKVDGSPVTIQLKSTINQLNDVVVVGYGTQRKGDLTGSVSKINAADVNKQPVASFDAQLQGKASGVQVITNSGVPGESIFVRVRGTTSINSSSDPLYVVDGVFLNNTSLQTTNLGGRTTSPLTDINPADIESIEILKDAFATAIYGSRGANGVVLITTKRGNYNDKTRISLDATAGWVQADPKTVPKMATGPESALLANEYAYNSALDRGQTVTAALAARPFLQGGDGTPEQQGNYDRIGDILQRGKIQDYNLSIQGGTNRSRYYLGAGYTDQEAIIKVPRFKRTSLKFNIDQNITNSLSFGLTNSFVKSDRNQARTGDGPQVNLWNAATSSATYTPKYGNDGVATGSDNIYVLIDNYDVKTTSLRYIGSVYGELKIIEGLKLKSSFSLDYDHYDEAAYWNSKTSIGKAAPNGQATNALTNNSTWINEQLLTYIKNFGSHHFNVVLGNSFQSNVFKYDYLEGSGFANDNFKLISSASIRTASQDWTKYTLASYFGRIDYNFNSRYYLGVTLRADGSSKFGANHKWGYFPGVSGAWRIKEESFLKETQWLTDLKLRASHGVTGNQAGIPSFAARGLWTGGSSYADLYGAPQPGIGPYTLGNPNLKWERTEQTNIGVDISLFNNRLNITADVYDKNTTDLLLSKPIPSSSGFNTIYYNAGAINNKGYELGITSTNILKTDFSWRSTLNLAGNRNRIVKLETPITQYTRDWVIMQEGYSMNSFWLYNQLSVNPKTGAPVFEGQAADGSVTTANRKILGNFYPKIYGGLNNSFTYKNLDLSFLFTFQSGNKALNLNRYFRERNPTSGGVLANVLNRWQKPGDITDIPRLTSVGTNYTIDQSSRYLEDASFLRLKQLTFGYKLPTAFVTRLKLTSARVYFVGSNLLLWTKYSGDPESSVTSNPNAQGLGSFGTPPAGRSFQFGLNVTI